MYRFKQIPPLIAATVSGPLGVMHLPRMWEKGVLSAAGLLWEGYFDDDKGFNHLVVEGIGLEPKAWFAFLKTLPTYPQAEDYVSAHATKLDAASIAALNAQVAGYDRPPEAAATTRARVGIDDATLLNSAMLLNFDDWLTIHTELLAHQTDGIEPLVPMVSSGTTGLLGIPHLPRLWFKALLSNVGALPEEWKTGPECGFDSACATKIGMDLVAACAFIKNELPTFLQFERWVAKNITLPDAATKAEWVASFNAMAKGEERAGIEAIECGDPDLKLRGSILLNDMVDWRYMHDRAVSQQVARA